MFFEIRLNFEHKENVDEKLLVNNYLFLGIFKFRMNNFSYSEYIFRVHHPLVQMETMCH